MQSQGIRIALGSFISTHINSLEATAGIPNLKLKLDHLATKFLYERPTQSWSSFSIATINQFCPKFTMLNNIVISDANKFQLNPKIYDLEFLEIIVPPQVIQLKIANLNKDLSDKYDVSF